VGFALAGGGTSWALSAGLGGGRSDVFLAGLYGSKQSGQAYVSGALTYAAYWMSTNRSINIAGPDTLTASFNAQDFGGRLEGGYRITSWAPVSFIPYAAVQAQTFWSPSYSETGSLGVPDPSALTFANQSATVVRSELGSRFDQIFAQGGGTSVDLFGRVAWAHDWQSNPNLTATFIGLPAATFVVNGAAPPHDLALATAGAEWRLHDGWSVMARFDGEFAASSKTYTGTAKVRYSW
jgi:outer membrane autotransporter protein